MIHDFSNQLNFPTFGLFEPVISNALTVDATVHHFQDYQDSRLFPLLPVLAHKSVGGGLLAQPVSAWVKRGASGTSFHSFSPEKASDLKVNPELSHLKIFDFLHLHLRSPCCLVQLLPLFSSVSRET